MSEPVTPPADRDGTSINDLSEGQRIAWSYCDEPHAWINPCPRCVSISQKIDAALAAERAARAAAEAESVRLHRLAEDAAVRYVSHQHDCRWLQDMKQPCTCGLDAWGKAALSQGPRPDVLDRLATAEQERDEAIAARTKAEVQRDAWRTALETMNEWMGENGIEVEINGPEPAMRNVRAEHAEASAAALAARVAAYQGLWTELHPILHDWERGVDTTPCPDCECTPDEGGFNTHDDGCKIGTAHHLLMKYEHLIGKPGAPALAPTTEENKP